MPDETRRSVLLKLSAGLSLAAANPALTTLLPQQESASASAHDLAGIWHSTYTYTYPSTSRSQEFTDQHFVVLRHSSGGLTGHSLPTKQGSELELHLSLERAVATGTWTERTAPSGYYKGRRLPRDNPARRRPDGPHHDRQALGFSKDFKVNSGPWTLSRVEESTSKRTQQRYHLKH